MNPIGPDRSNYLPNSSSSNLSNSKSSEEKFSDPSHKINTIGFNQLKFKDDGIPDQKKGGSISGWFLGKLGDLAMWRAGLAKKQHDLSHQLTQLSNGPEFGQILSTLGRHPQTVASVKKALGGIFGDAVSNFGSFPDFVETFLFTVVVNTSEEMKRESADQEITPTSVISFLFRKVSKELNDIHEILEGIKTTQKEGLTHEQLHERLVYYKKEMVQNLRKNLLKMIFPNDMNDIPLNPIIRKLFGSTIWNLINTKIERLLLDVDDLRKLNQFSAHERSQLINVDARRLAEACINIGQSCLKNDSQFAVENVVKHSSFVDKMDEGERNRFVEYFTIQIQNFGHSKDSGIDRAWTLLGHTLESFMTLIIDNVSKDKKPDETTSVMLVSKVLKTLSSFVKQHKHDIDQIIQDLIKRKKQPSQIKQDPAFINKFRTLANTYKEMAGLSTLPELIKGVFDTLFAHEIPQQLANNYEEVILPLVELFDAVDEPKPIAEKSTPDNGNLTLLCHLLGHRVANEAPSWIEGQSKNIADNIALNIPKASMEVREWISEWINGKLNELVNRKNEKLWNFVENTTPNVIEYILLHLSKGKDARGNLLFNALNTILERLNDFARNNGEVLSRAKHDQSKLIEIFVPFCEGLMEEFGIGFGQRLPVPELLNTTAEEQIKKILPTLCAQFYLDFFAMSQVVAKGDQLKQNETNEGLVKLTEVSSLLVSKWTPKLLEENSENLAEVIVNALIPSDQASLDDKKEQQKNLLKAWLTSEFRVIGPNLSKEYPEIWLLLGQGVESVLTHVFFNLSKGNDSNKEASLYGVEQIIETLHSFIVQNQALISETSQQFSAVCEDPFSHQEMINLFVPLSEKMQSLTGLTDFSGLFNGLLKSLFTKQFPAVLAKAYVQSLLPLNDLYEAVINPTPLMQREELKKLPGGMELASWCEIAGKYVGEEIPRACQESDQRQQFSEKIAYMIVMALANPEQRKQLEEQANSHAPLQVPVGLTDLYDWSCKWFESKIKASVDRNDPQLKKIWDFAKYTVDDLLAYILLNLVKEDCYNEDARYVLINKIIGLYIQFQNTHSEKINNYYIEINLRNQSLPDEMRQDPAKDKGFSALFLPLFRSIMQGAGIEQGQQLPIPKLLVGLGEGLLENLGPQLIADIYCNFNSLEGAAIHRERYLKQIQRLITPHEMIEEIPFGGTVQAIDSIASFSADQLMKRVKEIKVVKKDPVTQTVLYVDLEEALPFLKDPMIVKLWDGLQRSTSSLILQLFVQHLESLKSQDKPIDYMVIHEIIQNVIASIFIFTPEEEQAIEAALKIPTALSRKKALNALFAKRSSSLLSILKPVKDQPIQLLLPLPKALNDFVWNQLEDSIVPEFLLNIYMEKKQGQLQASLAITEMDLMTHSTKRSEVCDTLADFISKFIPAYTKLEHESISEIIYDTTQTLLSQSGNTLDALDIDKFLKQNKEILLKEIAQLMFKTSLVLDEMQPMTKENVRIVTAMALNHLSHRIDSFENPQGSNYDKDFLLKRGISSLELIKNHLCSLNEIAKEHNSSVFHNVDNNVLLRALKASKKLHPAVPQSEEALKAQKQVNESVNIIRSARLRVESLEKFGFLANKSIKRLKIQIKEQRRLLAQAQRIVKQERISNFFAPLSDDLLKLSGLDGADKLPFPSPLKEIIWHQVQTQVLPNVLMNVFNSVLEPKTINQMIITALEAYNAPTESSNENAGIKDPLQQKLDTVCGELLVQLAQMLPNSFTKNVLHFDAIKKISAEKFGQVLRVQLSEKLSVQSIIEMSLPSLDTVLKQTDFPTDDDSLEAQALNEMHVEDVLSQKVSADMEATAHKAISELITSSIGDIGNKFMRIWQRAVRKLFGKHTEGINRFFNWIGFRIIYGIIKWVLIIASSPLLLVGWIAKKIFWAIMDRHIGREVKHVIEGIHMSIHEDLIYKLTDHWIGALKAEPKSS